MKKLLSITLFFSAGVALAQHSLRPNIYFQNMNYYNTATGIEDTAYSYQISAYLKHKFTQTDNWKKPVNVFVDHIGRIDKISSFYSVSYIYDRYSFYDRNTIYAGYTYQLKLPKTHRLNFGVRGVFNFDYVNWERAAHVGNGKKREFLFTPDIDLGIQYQVKGLTLGIAGKNLISTAQRVNGEVLLKNRREFYANASYLFNIKQKVTIAPFTLFSMERNWNIDLGLHLGLFKRVNLSYAFRVKEFRHIYAVDVRLYKGLHIALAADHSGIYSDINADAMLMYRFK